MLPEPARWKHALPSTDFAFLTGMNGEIFVKLIEELVDLKVQVKLESNLKTSPEVAKVLHDKRESDRRRMELIKSEMARVLTEVAVR